MAERSNDAPGVRRFGFDRERQAVGLVGGLLLAFIARREAYGADLAETAAAMMLALEATGLFAAAAYLSAILDRRTALEVRAEGIWAPHAMPAPLRWREVGALRLRVTHLRALRLPTLEIAGTDGAARPARVALAKLDAPEREVVEAIERIRPVERTATPRPDAVRRAGRR